MNGQVRDSPARVEATQWVRTPGIGLYGFAGPGGAATSDARRSTVPVSAGGFRR